VGLGFRVESPVDALKAGQLGQPGWHMDKRVPVPAAGLQQEHAVGGIFGQPVSQHATGGAGPDDDVIEFHTLPY
jgi:hypothetical protein